MRLVQNPQMCFGQIDISKMEFNPKSRDDIPQVLKGLQYIYTDVKTREAIFALLEKHIAPKVNKKNGRPGMELWKILVLGCLRLNLNLGYDRLQEFANKHVDIRNMLGHSTARGFEGYYYEVQTIKDNVDLLTPELLDQINQLVIAAGYRLIKKKELDVTHGRCDSFVVETNVHFPTDINLLLDAMRVSIKLIHDLCEEHNISDWRQSKYNFRQVKKLMRKIQNKKRSKSGIEENQLKYNDVTKQAYSEYIHTSKQYLSKIETTLIKLEILGLKPQEIATTQRIKEFTEHGYRQIDQIYRRIILGEVIPHNEKVFSLFKPYTEWISKGKAGVPVELGVKLCIMEDQHQFILHHKVMEKQTDEQVTIEMVEETEKRFGKMKSVSFDKAFHSPANQKTLAEIVELPVLPRKGKLTKAAKEFEDNCEFRKMRRKHSAVESAINALEVHGLDFCPDYGVDNFKRYVSLAVVARNIQVIGAKLRQKELIKIEKLRKKWYQIGHMTRRTAA